MWFIALRELGALLVPPACCACGASAAAGEALCAACRAALPWLHGSRCGRCGLPAHRADATTACPAAGAAFSAAWAPLAYAGPARELVTALKFRGHAAAAGAMAAAIAAGAPPGLLSGATLVPVPARPARRRARGYDHAELLARALASRTGRPLATPLRRARGAAPQHGAGRRERLSGARLAVRAHGAVPSRAVLVDDVHTTGATLDACAAALRAAGTEQVVALAYARTL